MPTAGLTTQIYSCVPKLELGQVLVRSDELPEVGCRSSLAGSIVGKRRSPDVHQREPARRQLARSGGELPRASSRQCPEARGAEHTACAGHARGSWHVRGREPT